ncbi:RimJ/RimL family protein N-acetyltransferase [Breznakia sp. PF5-3]|uniref:GNAT family N-acetyltransferase n=1 Tax=unclassified Breznakia TaxID=2623764 RepID=UPI00240655D9|nr:MULTISPECIES: GNAT family N-acetyltransferase [unclassified Breznakia]MDL2276106.1 GNAT family N-acetyltransferase [Breznakia sp. OttesenSCG-928-G09]MDF9823870.1 RimJ/RimL family protein N-acetyltransferase [Breznakia sp. PM6-1]MDF9834669.1 RimJ/RimL family protein N-acetyltransferase [Breznakia sp. PF5-3]MDF9836896.1 RimJ/RimL family protein N-acetyltransferase [Breznakia sp. PFB2-8]MDF9858913.1 RimJ/RimL family protein N-acetyltransferase [Breznakia sp. PH5-24]
MIEITMAKDVDIASVANLAKSIWEEHFTPIIGEDQVAYMVDKFQSEEAIKNQILNEGYTYYKIVEDKQLVGYMAVKFNEEETFLSKLYLHESVRGKGYASFALKFLQLLCKERGCHSIWLTCNKDNANTIAKYKKMGFEIFDSVVNDIDNGFVMDDYYLRKTF